MTDSVVVVVVVLSSTGCTVDTIMPYYLVGLGHNFESQSIFLSQTH